MAKTPKITWLASGGRTLLQPISLSTGIMPGSPHPPLTCLFQAFAAWTPPPVHLLAGPPRSVP